jgi:carbon monoxide dehydrogenase subunit G
MTPVPTSSSRWRSRSFVAAAVLGLLASSTVAGAAIAAEPAADTEAPSSTLHIPFTPGSGWYTGAIDIGIIANDFDGSGVASIVYAVDGVETSAAGDRASIKISGDGVHSLSFSGVDNNGNREVTETAEFKIDGTGPEFEVDTPTRMFQGDSVRFDYRCIDRLSGAVDCGGTMPSGALLDTSQTGTFSQGLWGVDEAGNDRWDSFAYEVVARTSSDRTAPAVVVDREPLPPTGWYDGPTTATISASDTESAVASITYRINGGAAQTVAGSSAEVELTGDRRHGLQVWATDTVGNVSERRIHEFPIDGTAPTITVPTDVLYELDEEAYFDYSCSDEGSGLLECDSIYDPHAPLDTGSVGEHVIEVQAADAASHRTVVRFRYTVVDQDVPTVAIELPSLPASGEYDGPVEVRLQAMDNLGVREIRWQLTGATTAGGARGGAEATLLIEEPGTTTIEFVAIDVSGNSSRPQLRNVTISEPDDGNGGSDGDGNGDGNGDGDGNGGSDGGEPGDDGQVDPDPAGAPAPGNDDDGPAPAGEGNDPLSGDGLAFTGADAAGALAGAGVLLLLIGGTLAGARRMVRD